MEGLIEGALLAVLVVLLFLRDIRATWISFFNITPSTMIYTLSLHDALPIFARSSRTFCCLGSSWSGTSMLYCEDRKSTRLNSSHVKNSYAVFCLKKKKGVAAVSRTGGVDRTIRVILDPAALQAQGVTASQVN